MVSRQPLTCHDVILILGCFLLYSRVSALGSPCPSKKCCPTWPLISPLAGFLYFYNCSILLVVPSVSSLSSCFQYLLYTDGHLCPTFPVAEMSVHELPSALPMVEMSSLILALIFSALPSESAGVPLHWSEWALLDSNLLVLPAPSDLVLSRPLHSKSNLVISLIVYETQAWAICRAEAVA